MSQNSPNFPADEPSAPPEAGPDQPGVRIRPKPWVTILILGICVVQFFNLNEAIRKAGPMNFQQTLDIYREHGTGRLSEIWAGDWWIPLTATVLHAEAWHILFNGLALWALAQPVEFTLGRFALLTFWIACAAVSSLAQALGSPEAVGLGASGVVYGLVGLMWRSRERYPMFARIMTPGFVRYALIWLVGCMVVTWLGWLPIGNGAHLWGLIFGALVGETLAGRVPRFLPALGAGILLTASVITLFWAPWSTDWLSAKAFAAHEQNQLDRALDYYTRLIQLDPENSWAYHNRSAVHQDRGEEDQAEADWNRYAELEIQAGRKP